MVLVSDCRTLGTSGHQPLVLVSILIRIEVHEPDAAVRLGEPA